MDKALFGNTLAHYATREPKLFLQMDGHYMPRGGDDQMRPDGDGDAVTANGTFELMHGATVRVLIPGDSDPIVAARQLKKLAKWLKSKPSLLDYAQARSTISQPDFDDEIPF
jgi:hypothetical protein